MRRVAQDENVHRSYKPCRADEQLEMLLADKRKLKKRNTTLKSERDRLELDIQRAIERTRDLLNAKKNLLLALENARLDRSSAAMRLADKQRCDRLEMEIAALETEVQSMSLRAENIEQEYQVNLKRYDAVILRVEELSQTLSHAETSVLTEVNNLKALKSVNFDSEKLRRLLEQQKNAALRSQQTQNKSHQQRQKEYESTRSKLLKDQKKSVDEATVRRHRASAILLYAFLKARIHSYYRKFFTFSIYMLEGDKSIKSLENLGKVAYKTASHNIRVFFNSWKQKATENMKIIEINKQLLASRQQLKIRIKAMSTWNEQFNRSQLAILNDYEKGKILNSLRLMLGRKEVYMAFNKWRNTGKNERYQENKIRRLFKVSERSEKRSCFKKWRKMKDQFNRDIQSMAIERQFYRLRALSTGMRRWRFGMLRQQVEKGQMLLRRNEMRELINMRVRYLKRKAKVITILNIRGFRSDLRSAFYRYWSNVFQKKLKQQKQQVDSSRTQRDRFRLELKKKQMNCAEFRKKILTRATYKFMFKKKGLAFMDWYNKIVGLRKRSRKIIILVKKRDTKEKMAVMNKLRQNQRDQEKKEMHKVLTDLNNKMETINQKSTEYRQKLQQSIEQLSLLGAKKLEAVIERNAIMCQKAVFERYKRKHIADKYRWAIKKKVFDLAHKFMIREAMIKITAKARRKKRSQYLKQLQLKFTANQNKVIERLAFESWKKIHNDHRKACHILSKFETLYFFYRTIVGYKMIKQKVDIVREKELATQYKNLSKNLQTRLALLDKDTTEQNRLEGQLRELMIKFLRFQTLAQRNKTAFKNQIKTLRSINIWKTKSKMKTHMINTMNLLSKLMFRKQKQSAIRCLTLQKQMALSADIKDQMAKISKKRKSFEQKSLKSRQDVIRRLQQETNEHSRIKNKMERRVNRYEKYMQIIRNKNIRRQRIDILSAIWKVWKAQYSGAKRLFVAVQKNHYWDKLKKGWKEIKAFLNKMDNSYVRDGILLKFMNKKLQDLKRLGLQTFRYNIKATTISRIILQINEAGKAIQNSKTEYLQYAPLVASFKVVFRRNETLKKIYLAIKRYSRKRQVKKQKREKMLAAIDKRVLKQSFNILTWRRYFKQTSRQFVQFHKNKYDAQLLKDAFSLWKYDRNSTKWAIKCMFSSAMKDRQRNVQLGFYKIRNVGLYERDILWEKRRKALHHILQKKLADRKTIKQKYLYRWHFLLVPRFHYLVQLLDTMSRQKLLSPFYKIREHAYWHPYYINRVAEKKMQENKTETKTDMNLLLQENIDPEEIKAYMKTKNAKDTNMIRKVVSRIKAFGDREPVVRAWTSWLEYLNLKKNIAKSLKRLFTICDGKGKYWNRWRGKDQKFIKILEKQSRGNMLNKYFELSKLLKEYRKDVKNNINKTKQLSDINQEYENNTDSSKFLALRSLSSFIKAGLSKSLRQWRQKMLEIRQSQRNYKFDTLGRDIEEQLQRRQEMFRRLTQIQSQNVKLRQSCLEGGGYAHMLKQLLHEKQKLSIVLADKKHNMKILLEDNLKIKQKLKNAQDEAKKLISEFEPILQDKTYEEQS